MHLKLGANPGSGRICCPSASVLHAPGGEEIDRIEEAA